MARYTRIQKGIGRLKSKSIEEELEKAKTSVRRWWWEYLRLSKDYWLICQTTSSRLNPRTTDELMINLYRQFGDIYKMDFDTWYIETGSRIFMEQVALPEVEEIKDDLSNLMELRDGRLLLDIPLSMTQRSINKQINRILKAHQNERPKNVLEVSKSQFPINPIKFRLFALQRTHEVLCLHRELIEKPIALGKANDKYSTNADLFKIGKALKLSPSNEILTEESDVRHQRINRMRATVGRYLTKGKLLLGNVERGIFPSYKPIKTKRELFSKRQKESHAELELLWWDLDLSSHLSSVKIADARRIAYNWY